MTVERRFVRVAWCWNGTGDAYHIASNEDERSLDLWLSGLFVVPCIPGRDLIGMRVVDDAPAGRGTHPECSPEIELQDDFLVTSRDKNSVSTQKDIRKVRITYIVKPLRACSRCMPDDSARGSGRWCAPADKWP